MGKRDHRPVALRAADASVAARWLRGIAIPATRNMPGTILGGGYAEEIARLDRLAGVLDSAAMRKRAAGEFSALIHIEEAAAFARTAERCRPAWPLRHHPAIVRLAFAMRDGGARKRRGRNSLGNEEVSRLVAGKVAIDERHRLRLAARLRRSAAWEQWTAEVQARGQTILTTDLPFPKI